MAEVVQAVPGAEVELAVKAVKAAGAAPAAPVAKAAEAATEGWVEHRAPAVNPVRVEQAAPGELREPAANPVNQANPVNPANPANPANQVKRTTSTVTLLPRAARKSPRDPVRCVAPPVPSPLRSKPENSASIVHMM
ncbi:hypothetical protein LAUMK41_02959 [Mycobacterium attenuatum]|nr:hypothetical protein LAUMK41_02959 [Mycobacterium attenuatum]